MDRVTSRRAVGLCLITALALGCSGSPATDSTTATSERRVTTSTSVVATTTTVTLPQPEPVAWSPCGVGLDCATVTVPVDYADPGGDVLQLALVRRPAGDLANRIGSLLVNPGGPGASGVRRVERGFSVSPEVAARFDIVGFDPRGVGSSTPVTCGAAVPAFRAADLDPDSPEERAALADAARAVAEECAQTEGNRLAHLGTVEVVHDTEVIRRALGEAQVSFVGLSYGTLIGLLWAEAYPASVRALVLDGVVDPAAEGGAASGQQVAAIEEVVDAMDAACTADPGCPLQGAGGLLAAYDELARRIEAHEVTGSGVGPTQLAHAVFYATYDVQVWPRLWQAIADGLAGDLGRVAALARSFTGLVDYATFALVTCLDAPHPRTFEAWEADADELARRSPRFGRIVSYELLPCAWWPQSRFVPHPVVAEGTPPILVIGSTGDAATPYDQAVRVADTLAEGVLLTAELDGHVALGDSACVAEVATRYLVDLTAPAPGQRC